MIDSILAVIVLIIAGWAIAKNYDAKLSCLLQRSFFFTPDFS